VVLINIAAKKLSTLLVPIAINVNGITMLDAPISAYIFQSLENTSILIFLNKHRPNKGMLAKMTLPVAKVKGSNEWLAILILKKEEPHIIPNKPNKRTSYGLASRIQA